MHYGRTLLMMVFALLILPCAAGAADFDAWVVPNSTMEAGAGNVLFNMSVNNTNSTMNITMVNVTLPEGFAYVNASNQSSAGAVDFYNDSMNLTWVNLTIGGFMANLTEEWFAFNLSVNETPGDYYINVTVLDDEGVVNSTSLVIGVVDCNASLLLDVLSPSGGSEAWGEPVEVTGYIWDACGSPVEDALVNWTFSRAALNYSYGQNQSNQSLGYYNYTWTDTQRPPGWYNVTMNASRAGYPDNNTLLEDSFHLGYRPNITWVDMSRTGTCPDTFLFQAELTDADNDYNNVTLEVSLWDGVSQEWGGWEVANWSWQDQLSSEIVQFGQNFSNGSWEPGLYSYRFGMLDEFNLSHSLNGSSGFMVYNCSRVIDILTIPPTPSNGSNSSEPDITINVTFSSYQYDVTDCVLSYDNGTVTNFTENGSKGWCGFNISMEEGFYNYSVWVHNTYTNDSWNGTWYVGYMVPCLESWSYGEWGDCDDGVQYRTAADLNGCGTTDNRSSTWQECDDGGGGGGGGGGESYPTETGVWKSVVPGVPAVMSIARQGIAATSVAMEVSEQVGTCNVVVKGFSSKPAGVEPPNRTVHSYLNITTSANESRVSRVTIDFSVEKSWLEERGLNTSAIRLMRLDGNWTALETVFLGPDNDSLRFRAFSPGLSWFAIAVEGEENVTEEGAATGESPQEEQPGVQEEQGSPEGPEGGEAAPGEVHDICVPGESQCAAGILLQVCNAWGTGWINQERCLYGCGEGECSTSFVIEVDYGQLWVALAAIIILVALSLIYIKRKAIDDFLFWRL